MAISQLLGNAVDLYGTAYNVPEFGISEAIAGGNTVNTANTSGFTNDPIRQQRLNNQRQSGLAGDLSSQQQVNYAVTGSTDPSGGGDVKGASDGGGGGGGGGANVSGMNPADRNQWAIQQGFDGWNHYQDVIGRQSGGDNQRNEQFLQELNQAYEGAISPLRQAKQRIQDFRPGFLGDIRNQFGQQVNRQQTNLQSQMGNLEEQRGESQDIARNALGDARRVYNELLQANQSRFGGGSAGQFGSEILGRTTANQMGQVRQGLSRQMQSIGNEESRIKEETANNIASIEQQRDQTLRNAEFELQNKLGQIDEQIGLREADKANARLQALQDFRSQAQAIEQQARQLQQQQIFNAQQILAQLAGEGLVSAEDLTQGFGFGSPGLQIQAGAQAGAAQSPLRFLPGGQQQDDEQLQPVGAGAAQ